MVDRVFCIEIVPDITVNAAQDYIGHFSNVGIYRHSEVKRSVIYSRRMFNGSTQDCHYGGCGARFSQL